MQMKLVTKNGKIMTVMLLGTLLFGKRYLAVEYGYMLLVACGSYLLHGSEVRLGLGLATQP